MIFTTAKRALLIISFLLLNVSLSNAQISGLWEATKVQVGTEEMTPVAKWSMFNEDGSFTTGNGWLQNGDGTWLFNEQTSKLSLTTITGFDNEFGAFTVDIVSDELMYWKRTEDGQEVTVTYERITEVPKDLRTNVVGLWQIELVLEGETDITKDYTKDGSWFYHIRWDNLVNVMTSEGRTSGMWRVDAHRPTLDILYYDEKKSLDYWALSFENEDSMTWKREALTIQLKRLTAFPD
ncbi:MAG: hypothetical protein ED557_04340 [Balneola sp.]|nr:MAG: hypothetical protein ED557_04340 [Balneola sp.]